MTIADTAIATGQVYAESLMTLTLTAYAPTGNYVEGPDGFEVPEFINRGTTPGKVQGGSQAGKDTETRYADIGGVKRPVLVGGLHIPLSAFVVAGVLDIKPSEQVNQAWQFHVTAVNGLADLSLLGRKYQVVEVPAKSYATARRLSVVEVV